MPERDCEGLVPEAGELEAITACREGAWGAEAHVQPMPAKEFRPVAFDNKSALRYVAAGRMPYPKQFKRPSLAYVRELRAPKINKAVFDEVVQLEARLIRCLDEEKQLPAFESVRLKEIRDALVERLDSVIGEKSLPAVYDWLGAMIKQIRTNQQQAAVSPGR